MKASRLEVLCAPISNYFARQGWVVKAMSTPHLKDFGGGTKEEVVILLER